jgi:hypothetical protein
VLAKIALTETLEPNAFVKLILLALVLELVKTPVVDVRVELPDTVTDETVLLKLPIESVPPVCT